jgi:hypothetical protein
MVGSIAFTQAKSGVENYNQFGQGNEYVWMPVVHYQTNKGMYAELRYNYEDIKTLSLYAGKTLTGGSLFQYNFTPMAGYCIGKFTGLSLAANAEAEWKDFYFSTQTQYSMATKKNAANFFFSWSEAGYNVFRNFFAGLAVQYTRQQGVIDIEPGFVTGFTFKNISIPLYVFSPFQPGRFIVLGFNYEYHLKKKE